MYSRTISRTVSTVSPLVAALALAMPVSAQNLVLEEVVITAQKRAQSLMDVPISVSAVTGEKMVDAGIRDLGDLAPYVPNFTKSDTSIGQIIAIRGISSGINRGFEQSVVQYMDDVALTRGVLARAPFMDLARVEVLRGPQNVLFGKNSVAGALSFVTNKPSDEFEGSLGAEYRDEDNLMQFDGMVSGPITDKIRGRLVARSLDSDGFYENNLTGDDDGGREERAVRVTLGMDFTDNIDATLKLERSTFDMDGRGDELIGGYKDPVTGLGYAELGNAFLSPLGMGSDDGMANRKRNTNVKESSNNEVDNATFTLNWDLGGISMTSVSAYLSYDQDEYLDVDGSGFNFLVNDISEDFEQYSQELRFVSPGGETIDWIAGGYFQHWDLDTRNKTPFEVGGPGYALAAIDAGAVLGYNQTKDFDSTSDTYAVFAQATWNMSDTWRLTLGGRYTVEDKEAQRFLDMQNTATGSINPGFGGGSDCSPAFNADLCAMVTARIGFGQDYNSLGEFDQSVGGALSGILGVPLNTHDFDQKRSEDFFTPTVILEWDATDNTMAYINLSQGKKAGGFDGQGSLGDPDLFEFEEETANSAEIGFKSSFAGGVAELNAAMFYVKYDDLQVSVFDGLVGFVVDNAAEAETMGVELDGRWLVTEGLTLSGSAGYLDFEFNDWPEAQCSAGLILAGKTNPDGKTCDYSGRENIFTPEFTSSLSADYIMPLTGNLDLHGNVDVNYRGSQYVDPTLDDSIKEDSVALVNARIALETGNWTLALVGKNLTDEDTYSYITETPLSASVTKGVLGAGYAAYTGYQEQPRTYALQLFYRF